MCGIIGQVSFDKNINRPFLKKGLNALSHRGKDSKNYDVLDFVSLGHNLLSITGDITNQPIYNESRTVVAVVNGEFYGFEEIKKELKHHHFSTNSDSEIIVHLYEDGLLLDYLKNGKLNGEFSFFLYDIAKNKAYLARDPFGIKPLYIYRSFENIYFASEIKAFLNISELSFDEQSVYSVLTMQYHDTYNTLFKDVKQIQPGTIVQIDIGKRTCNEKEYFKLSFDENNTSFEDNKIILLDKLKESVRKRTTSNKKIGFALSGGIDSSAILALASENVKDLHAYTISFKDSADYDEYLLAEEMAKMYGAKFNPIIVNERVLLDNLESSIFHSEQVSINSHVSSKYLLFKAMADDGCKVSLSGEGSDEILFGYPHFKLDLNFQESIMKNQYLNGLQMPDSHSLDTSKINQALGFVPAFLKAKYSMGYKMHEHIMNDSFKSSYVNFDPASYIIRLYGLDKKQPPIFNSSFLWSKICMSNYILNALGDKLEMAHTIEGRVPFLDRELFQFVRSIPINQKINKGNEKYILKEVMKPYISEAIYNKQKHPFLAPPLMDWKNNKYVYNHLMDIIHSSTILNNTYLSQSKILNMLDLIMKKDLNPASFDPVVMIILSMYYLEKNFVKGNHHV
jgi:asparagine synthase (glutamine-hydrolysing)